MLKRRVNRFTPADSFKPDEEPPIKGQSGSLWKGGGQGSATSGDFQRLVKALVLILSLLILWISWSFLSNRSTASYSGPPRDLVARASKYSSYHKVPQFCKHTFYIAAGSGDFRLPVTRALRSLGWKPTNNDRTAHLIWDKYVHRKRYGRLHPWQRYNHIPGFPSWDRKDSFAKGFQDYKAQNPEKNLYFLPETFTLGDEDGQRAFERRLENGGLEQPWVLKVPSVNNGKGIEMLGGRSDELVGVVERVRHEIEELAMREAQEAKNATEQAEAAATPNNDEASDNEQEGSLNEEIVEPVKAASSKKKPDDVHRDYVIQPYICNELTWFGNRKFDLRMYWMVPSLDPLIVLYSDGYARIGNSVYDETNFHDTTKQLTAMTRLADEAKGTMDQYKELVSQHYAQNSATLSKRFKGDPYQHLRNQMKEAIAETVAAFRDKTFGNSKEHIFTAENGFSLHGADFIIDQSLDVWYLESQAGPALIEDYDFRVDLHRHLLRSTFTLMQEIQDKVEYHPERNVLPFTSSIEGWDIVYAGDWMYQYDEYDRKPTKQRCKVPIKRKILRNKKRF